VEATHALRGLELRGKAAEAARQETARAVAVAALTLVGATVLGDSLLRDVGLPVDDAQRRQLRGFVMELMLTHLMRRGS
jgi:hypothetical protein